MAVSSSPPRPAPKRDAAHRGECANLALPISTTNERAAFSVAAAGPRARLLTGTVELSPAPLCKCLHIKSCPAPPLHLKRYRSKGGFPGSRVGSRRGLCTCFVIPPQDGPLALRRSR